jgi:DNA-binding GntR family transcriptional regulator
MADEKAKEGVEARLVREWRSRVRSQDGGSAADVVYAGLTDAIVSRRLPPGWRLSEERLATLFGVSRTPIREALTRLAQSSLAKRDDRGTLRIDPITAEKILEVYAVRQVLDGLSAHLAARVATPIALIELRQLNDMFADAVATRDHQLVAKRNLDFHAAMARAGRNELLTQFVDTIHTWIRRIPTTTLSYENRAEESILEHGRMLDAIAERDAERAERLAREHMAKAESIRIAMLVRGD